jgi:hypothetical protein
MTPRTFLSIFLLALIFPAREIWQLWKTADREVNWFLIIDYPLSIQWYFKFLGAQISEFLMALVIYRITYKIQALRMAAVVVLIYSLVDLMMFFVCFNKAGYALIYTTIGMVSLLVIYWRVIARLIKEQFHKLILRHKKIA